MLKTHEECIVRLEKIRWNGGTICPYCGSIKATSYKKEHRYRCNSCFTSYSVTVGTIFHKTHVDLGKWFHAIALLSQSRDMSVRQLAREIQVSREAAAYMIKRIQSADSDDAEMLKQIERDRIFEN